MSVLSSWISKIQDFFVPRVVQTVEAAQVEVAAVEAKAKTAAVEVKTEVKKPVKKAAPKKTEKKVEAVAEKPVEKAKKPRAPKKPNIKIAK